MSEEKKSYADVVRNTSKSKQQQTTRLKPKV